MKIDSTIIAAIIAAITTLIAIILKKIFEYKKTKAPIQKPVFFELCIGRKHETKIIVENIIKRKDSFVYGPAGIGKTTVVRNAVRKVGDKRLRRLYPGGVHYYDFYSNSDFSSAYNELTIKIQSGISDTRTLEQKLDEKKCLIIFEGTERTNELDKFLQLSLNPVFIVTSRNKSQLYFLKKYKKNKKIEIPIGFFDENISVELLREACRNNIYKTKKFNDVLREIADNLCYLPLAIFLAANDKLFNQNIEAFLSGLKENGLKTINKNITLESERDNIVLLIDRALGISNDNKSFNIPYEAKQFLGFLGCISYEDFYIDEGVLETVGFKVNIEELEDLHILIQNDYVIKPLHALIYKELKDNWLNLINTTDLLYSYCAIQSAIFLNTIDNTYFEFDENRYFIFLANKNHFRQVVFCCINNDIDMNEDKVEILAQSIFVLSQIGFINETLKLYELLNAVEKNKSISKEKVISMYVGYADSLIWLDKFQEGLKIFHDLIMYYTNQENREMFLISVRNCLENSIRLHYYQGIKNSEYEKIIDIAQSIVQKEEDYVEAFSKELVYLKILLLEDQIFRDLLESKNTCENIDFDLWAKQLEGNDHKGFCKNINYLKFIQVLYLFKTENIDVGISLLNETANFIQDVYTYHDPEILKSYWKIARFFEFSNNYLQSNELYNLIIKRSIKYYGASHPITNYFMIQHKYINDKINLNNESDRGNVLFVVKSNENIS